MSEDWHPFDPSCDCAECRKTHEELWDKHRGATAPSPPAPEAGGIAKLLRARAAQSVRDGYASYSDVRLDNQAADAIARLTRERDEARKLISLTSEEVARWGPRAEIVASVEYWINDKHDGDTTAENIVLATIAAMSNLGWADESRLASLTAALSDMIDLAEKAGFAQKDLAIAARRIAGARAVLEERK